MIQIDYEDGMDDEDLPIDNLSREELMNRIIALEDEAIKHEDTYSMTISVC